MYLLTLKVSANEIILSSTRSSATWGCGHIGVVASFFARLNIIFYGAVVGHLFLSLTFGPTCAIKFESIWNTPILINMRNTKQLCSSSNALLLTHPCCTPSTSHCTICIAWGSRPPDSRPLWCRSAAGSNPLIPPLIAVNHKRTSCCSVFSLPAFLSQFNLDIDILDKKTVWATNSTRDAFSRWMKKPFLSEFVFDFQRVFFFFFFLPTFKWDGEWMCVFVIWKHQFAVDTCLMLWGPCSFYWGGLFF